MELFFMLIIISVFFIIEIIFYGLVNFVNKRFHWLIIAKDEMPTLSKNGLKKFIPHGYDSELGWIRKPNTSDVEIGKEGITKWTIDSRGCRYNPDFENLESKISCYGDSFVFCRQVNDDETWEYYLSKFQNTNVQNFGVGNYGFDQALLRLKREYQKNRTKIVICAIVPDTVSRILSLWKHYYEYGNTFAFKPRFIVKNEKLQLIKNYIDNEKKFDNYQEFLPMIRSVDFFYENKFKKEVIRFPYSITIFKNTARNFSIIFWVLVNTLCKIIKKDNKIIRWKPMRIIMRINLLWRVKLYQNNDILNLFEKLIMDYVLFANQNNFKPIFIILPQKDDVNFIKNNFHFYNAFIDRIKDVENLHIIDIAKYLILENDIDALYSDNNEYGGHFSKLGNKKVAEIINNKLGEIHID